MYIQTAGASLNTPDIAAESQGRESWFRCFYVILFYCSTLYMNTVGII